MATLIHASSLRRVMRLDNGNIVEYYGKGVGWEGLFVILLLAALIALVAN